jgi:single-strand DNA-binding protein
MVNKVIIIGNLGQDPDIRFSQSGAKIASFSVATTESWKDKASGERKSITEWHRVVVFNENLADIVEKYIKKGSKVFVEGSLKTRKYTGTDGVEKNITEIVISQFKGEITMLDGRSSADNTGYDSSSSSSPTTTVAPKKKENKSFDSVGDDLDDEIPF